MNNIVQQMGQPKQVKVDFNKCTNKKCECGCVVFARGFRLGTLSALLSPTGIELPVELPVLYCVECKKIVGF